MLDYLDSFVFHTDTFRGHHIAEEPNLFLMESTLLQVGIQQELPELFQNPPYGCDVTIPIIISVNEDVIQIYDDKDVELLSKDLVDVFLEACWCVCQTERHHLVLKVAVSSPERGLLLVPLADSHSMVGTSEVELGESFSSSQPIQRLPNQRQRVPVFDREVVEVSVIDT